TAFGPIRTQPRKNLATDAQTELADSIRRVGILQPITVRYLADENVYQIISGERRFMPPRLPASPKCLAGKKIRKSKTFFCTRWSRTGNVRTGTELGNG